MKRIQLALAAATLFTVGSAQAQLVFNNNFLAGTSAQAQAAIIQAEARWSALFTDNVTMNITIGTGALGSGIIASTGSTQNFYNYSSVRSALVADAKSANDAIAVANLQAGSNFKELINYTANNPNGTGSATAYLDSTGANTSTIRMSNANAKALGLLGASGANDASMTFSNTFAFDFDPSDGISAGTLDFVGVVTHEIGHALGFISGVDILDINSTSPNFFNDDEFTYASTLDLFRYSAASKAVGAIDYTAGNAAKYFSLDGGTTVGPQFATGTVHGDGRQASHWKDNLGIGIMDPTFAFGELGAISANDIMGFDAIGWDLKVAAVPEPSTYAMFGLGLAAVAFMRRRKQQA
ncbi:MAG: NF038122 family metalloprotease [Burkholderiales bacterium]